MKSSIIFIVPYDAGVPVAEPMSTPASPPPEPPAQYLIVNILSAALAAMLVICP